MFLLNSFAMSSDVSSPVHTKLSFCEQRQTPGSSSHLRDIHYKTLKKCAGSLAPDRWGCSIRLFSNWYQGCTAWTLPVKLQSFENLCNFFVFVCAVFFNNSTKSYCFCREVSILSCNLLQLGLAPLGNKPLPSPMLTKINITIWGYYPKWAKCLFEILNSTS